MVNLPLNDWEATEVEYAIHYRIRSLNHDCPDCNRIQGQMTDVYCYIHASMVGRLQTVLARLVATGFSLKS